MVRVKITVKTEGRGETRAWWARYTGLGETGEGSDRRIVATGDPSWLPRIREGEAWIDLPAGTVIRAGASHFGGYRRAQISSPPLIVEQGREWTAVSKDGTRHLFMTLIGARPATPDDLNASLDPKPSPLAAYSDEELAKELERRGYLVLRATADAGAQ